MNAGTALDRGRAPPGGAVGAEAMQKEDKEAEEDEVDEEEEEDEKDEVIGKVGGVIGCFLMLQRRRRDYCLRRKPPI